jgi:Short C-terminal domain
MPASGGGHDTEEARAMLRGARVVRRRTLLRAAAAGGLAHRAGRLVDRARIDEIDARLRASSAPAPAPASLPAPEIQARLKMLGDLSALRERGALSDEEFARQKQRVLEG